MTELAARESAAAWELRAAWALRRLVVLRLDYRELGRLAGWVAHVDATSAGAEVETVEGGVVRVECARVLAVRAPHWHEPADGVLLALPQRSRRETVLDRFPGQLALFEDLSSGALDTRR